MPIKNLIICRHVPAISVSLDTEDENSAACLGIITDKGREIAHSMGLKIKEIMPNPLILSSWTTRTFQTAFQIAQVLGKKTCVLIEQAGDENWEVLWEKIQEESSLDEKANILLITHLQQTTRFPSWINEKKWNSQGKMPEISTVPGAAILLDFETQEITQIHP